MQTSFNNNSPSFQKRYIPTDVPGEFLGSFTRRLCEKGIRTRRFSTVTLGSISEMQVEKYFHKNRNKDYPLSHAVQNIETFGFSLPEVTTQTELCALTGIDLLKYCKMVMHLIGNDMSFALKHTTECNEPPLWQERLAHLMKNMRWHNLYNRTLFKDSEVVKMPFEEWTQKFLIIKDA